MMIKVGKAKKYNKSSNSAAKLNNWECTNFLHASDEYER